MFFGKSKSSNLSSSNFQMDEVAGGFFTKLTENALLNFKDKHNAKS